MKTVNRVIGYLLETPRSESGCLGKAVLALALFGVAYGLTIMFLFTLCVAARCFLY